ncbi:isocitrate lyase/PEP mutase family protein [Saccharothrix xinjiangensis]|uniref:Isocitrate lyase/PEP mutase family protein n=1 Tax=Saccharothrix xinjiangensis TaxID=204798 RepID=A0ABV9Y6J8_9PSEU
MGYGATGYGEALRRAVASNRITPVIGVYDMMSASIAARHYDALFVSGFGLAASHYGLPDIGFIAWPDVVAFVQRLRLAFPRHHLLVDIDDGYVDAEVACHVVRSLEQVGASGVVLEDQRRPRRCGHVGGKQVLPLPEYLEKLGRVLGARADLFVVARTDATEEPEMLRRAAALAATDADAVLVDGVPSVGVVRGVREAAGAKPVVFNQIAGGRSPRLDLADLAGLGVDVAIYSTPCLFAAHAAIEDALVELKRRDGALPDGPIGVAESQALLARNTGDRGTPVPRPAPEFSR